MKIFNKVLIIGLPVLILALAGFFGFKTLTLKSHDNKLSNLRTLANTTKVILASTSAKIASVSASPKPATKSAQTIPVNFGNSVRVPILMYHYIGNNPNPADKARDTLSTAPDVFDAQMGYLSSAGFTPISLDTLYAALKGGGLPPRPIVLTFDDGYIDFYINAFPILKKYGFHATSFIPTSLMNQSYYMSWAQIKELQSSGLISFEAHTLHHVNLPSLSQSAQQFEISQSKKDLEAQIGVPVNFFAYPYGTSNEISWNLVKQSGFFGAVGTWFGSVESEGTQYDWPRIRISGGLSLEDFKKKF